MKRLLLALVLLAAIAAGLAYVSLGTAYQGFGAPVILEFPKGTSTQSMADELARSGVIRYSWQFLMARALHSGKKLQAGEYLFSRADTPSNIFSRIQRGDVFFYELVVPEGSNMFDIAASLARFNFLKPADFLRAARSQPVVGDLAPD